MPGDFPVNIGAEPLYITRNPQIFQEIPVILGNIRGCAPKFPGNYLYNTGKYLQILGLRPSICLDLPKIKLKLME